MLYVYKQENCTLPNTITEMFEVFILNALKRNARKLNQYKLLKRLRALDKLPDPVKPQFEALCKMAYESFVVHKVVFSYDDLESAFPHCDPETELESNLLSLMTASKSFTSRGAEVNYQFLHLNIQEFLAAKWSAVTQSPKDQAQFIKDYLKHSQYRNVLKFLAGISKLKGTISDMVFPKFQSLTALNNSYHLQLYTYHHRKSHDAASHSPKRYPASCPNSDHSASSERYPASRPNSDHSAISERYPASCPNSDHSAISERYRGSHWKTGTKYTSNKTFRKFLLLTQLIHESQNVTMYPRLLCLLDNQNELSFCFYRLIPAECMAVAHFLVGIEHTWKVLGFHFCDLTDHSLEIFQKVSSGNYGGSQFEEVEFSYNAPSFIKQLSLLPEITWFRNTKVVSIEGLQYPDGVSAKEIELHKIFSMKCLTDLTISVQSIPAHHLSDYLKIFSKFTDALQINKTLKGYRMSIHRLLTALCLNALLLL